MKVRVTQEEIQIVNSQGELVGKVKIDGITEAEVVLNDSKILTLKLEESQYFQYAVSRKLAEKEV